ncbi:MAG: tyrosine-type recombinase/integrase [Candidatus Thiodiazotropha sp. (ex Semelilucina semeliformis)]|nr:tyrosine-type recombinase/integrase [Candidatus Thiodiazotropha sp. (ex Semelilucina semeliformis)]
MATIRKLPSKRWYVEVRKYGQRKSKTFDTKLNAVKWAEEIEQTLNPEGLIQGKTVGDAFEKFRDEITPTRKSHRSEHNRMNKFLRDPVADIPLDEVRQHHFDDWIKRSLKRIQASSVNRDLNLLSAVFREAIRWRWMSVNPIHGINRPKNPPPRDRRISEAEIKKILKALEFDGKAVVTRRHEIAIGFLLAIETAMRQGELWNLDWQDVYLTKKFVRLHTTKNGTKRDVPLSKEAVRLLNLLSPSTEGKVFKGNQASSGVIFRRALQLANISGLTFHDTRHEAITRLAQKVPLLDLARIIGHLDPRSLLIYYNATAEEIAERLD